ncbi:VOC family protein [Thermoactinospora rubra]|uniref:VOC family protein n=1 Tax=Thermoactinospora rubra TaxID=1088767 RepID=UPI000A0F4755|nr:VOC family protein [Thermoactinospora rubra]
MQKIKTHLWFDNQAEEAARFYTSVFKNSRIVEVQRFETPEGPVPSFKIVTFELDGQEFIALDGGPEFKFNEAISLYVDCEDQAEVDELWAKLTEGGGEPGPCGWLKDRYGLSWQIVPRRLEELIRDPDPGRAQRAMKAMLAMKKIEVAELEAAANG